MLKKIQELEICPEQPFANDTLDRKGSIENLTSLIESTEQPFVMSIEAPWGWGKTTFIRMWREHLTSKGHVCLGFNAWENDFVDDPLVAFLGEMRRIVEQKNAILGRSQPVKEHWEKVKHFGASVLRKALPITIQVATHGLLNQDAVKNIAGSFAETTGEVAEFASNLAEERLKDYDTEKEGMQTFRLNLEQFASEAATTEGHKPPLVFFIDELDRCRPDFAIRLLERVKHLFNVKRIVFILAIDRDQLNQSVRALYGVRMDSNGYLRKFIDLSYSLPAPSTEKFVGRLYEHFGLTECFQLPGMGETYGIRLKEAFTIYTKAFGLSLRTQEQCFIELNIVLRVVAPPFREFPAVLVFLVTVRAFKPNLFKDLRERKVDIDSVLKWIEKIDKQLYKNWAEAALMLGFLDPMEVENRLKQTRRPGPGSQNIIADLENLVGRLCRHFDNNAVQVLMGKLEMTSQFH